MSFIHAISLVFLLSCLSSFFLCPINPRAGAMEPAQVDKEGKRMDFLGDPLPENAIARLGTRRLRENDSIWSAALSPDGKKLITGSDSEVNGAWTRFWDLTTGKEFDPLPGAKRRSSIHAVAFSPDGKNMAAGGYRRIDLWKVATQWQDILRPTFMEKVRALAFSPDGSLLASGGKGRRRLLLWDVKKREVVHRLDGHQSMVLAVAFSPDGKLLASGGGDWPGGGDHTIRLWDVATGKIVAELGGHKHVVSGVAFSPSGKILATASSDKRVLLWDVATKRVVHELKVGQTACAVAFSKDGKLLASGAFRKITLWNPATGKEIRSMATGGYVRSVSFTPDGKTLVATNGPNVQLWDVATGKEGRARPGHLDVVQDLEFSPDGKYLASLGDGTVRIWDPLTGKQLHTVEPALGGGQIKPALYPEYPDRGPLSISPDGKVLAVPVWSPGSKETIHLLDLATGKKLFGLRDASTTIFSMDFSPDGKVLAATGSDGIRFWSLPRRKELRLFESPPKMPGPRSALFLPGGQTVVANGSPPSIRDAATGKTLGHLEQADQRGRELVLSPDGRLLAAVGGSNNLSEAAPISVWEVATGQLLCTIAGQKKDTSVRQVHDKHSGAVAQIALSPDGLTLASAGRLDKTVRLWDVVTGKQLAKFEGHDGGVTAVAFSPDGRTLASGSTDTTILLWDVRKFVRRAGAAPDDDALQRLWADLRAADPKTAYKAMDQLARAGGKAVDLLQKRLQPIQKPDKERVQQLLGDLEAGKFAVREKATAALAGMGELVEDELRQALNNNPKPDAKRRLESLLADLRPFVKDAELLRGVRGVQVLERIGSPEAHAVLEKLASGAVESRLTRDAKATLSRLRGRASESK